MSDYIELTLRWIFALQMVFWGLNGFFNWIKLPPASPAIEKFVQACIETRFIMPSIKLIEIIFGAFLLLGFVIPISLLIFAPLLFIISGLHILYNPRPWGVLVSYTLPYAILLFIHSSTLLRLVH